VAEDKDPLLMFLGSCWGLEKVVLVTPRFCSEGMHEGELDVIMKMVEGRINGVESWVRDKNWRWMADMMVTRVEHVRESTMIGFKEGEAGKASELEALIG